MKNTTMKLEIITSAENTEMAIFMLSQAIESASKFETFKEVHKITDKDIEKAEKFRQALLKSFLK